MKFPIKSGKRLILGLLLLFTPCLANAQNLLRNGDFSVMKEGAPAAWKLYSNKQKVEQDTKEIFGEAKQSLRVDVMADGGNSLGQIVQKVLVNPKKKYLLQFDAKSSAAGMGVGQIKLFVGTSEIGRTVSGKTTLNWETIKLEFDSGEAIEVWVNLRYEQDARYVGQQVWFSNVSLTEVKDAPAAP